MDEGLQFGIFIRTEWEERSGTQERGHHDKVNTEKCNQFKVQLTDSLRNFLGKPTSTSSSSSTGR